MAEMSAPVENMNQEEIARLAVDMMHRLVMHHAMWFREVEYQFGMPKALEMMREAYQKSYGIQTGRLAKTLGFNMVDGVPEPLLSLPRETLLELVQSIGINWLAGDGVWFQTVEEKVGMYDAKRCNDTCWARFSPFEAWSIKEMLRLPDGCGLEGLKQALQFRMYAFINKQVILDDGPDAIIFRMEECRVQAARKKKGLADYPCKSAGVVEYRTFAETIDPRIQTVCVGCPPDDHPDEWWCAWRFFIPDGV